MPVPTTHPQPRVQGSVDAELCIRCGMCIDACPTQVIGRCGEQVVFEECGWLGCIACAQCMCACPTGAVRVEGRGLRLDQITELPPTSRRANFEQLEALLLARRSIRKYRSQELKQDEIEQILNAAALAPMGIPPSEVRILAFAGHSKVRQFSLEMNACFRVELSFLKSPFAIPVRLTMPREDRLMMERFIIPLLETLTDGWEMKEDWLFYDAPLALLFYSSRLADQADVTIAATYSMLAATALGIGSCLVGSVGPFMQRDPALLKKYGIQRDWKLGPVLIAGYPELEFHHAVRRELAGIRYA